jgi:excisionase family DNA binding protein
MVMAEALRTAIADDEAYSRGEAQKRLGDISKQTLLELERQGRIRAVRLGRRVVYPRSEIVRLLSANDDNCAG